jgi:rubredoxin
MSSFENIGRADADPRAQMECGVCWTVYVPEEGDPLGRAPPGTAFAALPEDWRCPTCDAPPTKFMRHDDAS